MTDTNSPQVEQAPAEPPISYTLSPNFPDLLTRLGQTLALTTYQAGKLCFLSANQNKLRLLMRTYNKAMGLFVDNEGLILATRNQIWSFIPVPELIKSQYADRDYDMLYLPIGSQVTGDVAAHDVFRSQGQIHFVNTLFSCIARTSDRYSFIPTWKPSFIDRLVSEDRCHLNSIALDQGNPRYAVALSNTNYVTGWRPLKNTAGCVIDIETNEVIYQGLSMPHAPRLMGDRLLLLNSGKGELGYIDLKSGQWQVMIQLPGFLRGLALYPPYAFVGLSKIRETATFGGVAIEKQELQCGVYVVNLLSGTIEAWLTFDKGIEELYDVQLVPYRHPFVLGFQKEDINRMFHYPPEIF